ncbi:MAG: ATP-binding cassette domain-containing protein, partial [Pseudaminobacter sp.]
MAARSLTATSPRCGACRACRRPIWGKRLRDMLELDKISTSYGQIPMLRDVSLHVGRGEIVCLLGPNGAGKSTTFNAICGLL